MTERATTVHRIVCQVIDLPRTQLEVIGDEVVPTTSESPEVEVYAVDIYPGTDDLYTRFVLTLDREVWEKMGAPDTVTLSIEPGNRLDA